MRSMRPNERRCSFGAGMRQAWVACVGKQSSGSSTAWLNYYTSLITQE